MTSERLFIVDLCPAHREWTEPDFVVRSGFATPQNQAVNFTSRQNNPSRLKHEVYGRYVV